MDLQAELGPEIVIRNHHSALIDPVLYDDVQRLRRQRRGGNPALPSKRATRSQRSRRHVPLEEVLEQRREPTRKVHGVLPPGLTTCGHCGGRMYARLQTRGGRGKRSRIPIYECERHKTLGKGVCPQLPVLVAQIDREVGKRVLQAIRKGRWSVESPGRLPVDTGDLDVDLADLAQRRERLEASPSQASYNARSFLGNLIHCGRCGALMSFVGGEGHGNYRCNSRLRKRGYCGMPPVEAGLIDIQAVKQITDTLALLWRTLHRDLVWSTDDAFADRDAVCSQARQTVEGYDAQVTEAIECLERGYLDDAAFHRRIAVLDEHVAGARRLLDTGDVWDWLLRLFGQDEDGHWRQHLVEDGGLFLFMPLDALVSLANENEGGHWRQLVTAVNRRLEVIEGDPPRLVGEWSDDPSDYAGFARMQGPMVAKGLVIDVRLNLRTKGYRRLRYLEDGREFWRLEGCPTDLILGPSADDPRGYTIEMRPNMEVIQDYQE